MKRLILTHKNYSSFTLIELMIVLTVTAIITSISLAYYNNFTQQLRLKRNAKKLLSTYELAKKKAMAGDLYQDCDNFTGYTVDVGYNSYTFNFVCNSVPTTINTYSFDTGINTINTIGKTSFNSMGGFATETNEITLKNQSLTKCIDITISSIGVISLNETLDNCD